MKQYQKLFMGLSLLIFISCGSSGGGGSTSSTPQSSVNGEVLKEGETSTTPIVVEDGEIQISNGTISINDASKTALSASNGGQVTNGTDGIVSGVFAVGMGASGSGSQVTNDGKVIAGTVENTSRSVVSNYTEEIERIGMKASDGAKAINNGEISGTISEGIVADGAGSTATNNGKISSTGVEYTYTETDEDVIVSNETGTTATGMKATDGATVTNGEDGVISGTIGEGMRADGEGSTAINNGSISSTGIEGTNTYIDENGETQTESWTGATGMKATEGGSVTNNGTISGTIEEGMRAQGEESSAVNNGKISSTGEEYEETYTNIYTDEDGTKDIYKGIYSDTGAIGMKATEGGSITNNGTISGTIGLGMRAQGEESTAINNGTISSSGVEYEETYTHISIDEDGTEDIDKWILSDTYTVGMYARDGGSVTNGETGIISGTIGRGMYARGEGSTAVNDGSISSTGYKYSDTYTDEDGTENTYSETIGGTGMRAYDGGSVTNGETGVISGTIETGMSASGEESIAINNGSISSDGVEDTDSYTDADGVEQTYKNIDGGTGMETWEGSITNNGTISGTLSYGMDASGEGSTAVNNGEISFDGIINTSFYNDGDGTVYENKYINATGMYAGGGATITNGIDGVISGALVTGMSGRGTNLGTITIEQIEGEIPDYLDISGMKVNDGATAINEATGIINLNSIDSNGMYAYGTAYDENWQPTSVKSTIENYGTININAENGIGMSALYGATAINGDTGIINLNSSNGIGMYATGEGSTIENRGEIYLSGLEVSFSRDNQTAEEIATSFGTTINGEDNKGNIGMKIENGAKMINKGNIVFGGSPVNGEVLKKGEISTTPIVTGNGEIQISNGNLTVNNVNKVAMTAGAGGQITNGIDGTVSGTISEKMRAAEEGSAAINNGNISSTGVEDTYSYTDENGATNTNSQTNGGTGMLAYSGGTVTNGETGIISGIISEGMKAEGEGSAAINNGSISSIGTEYTDSYTDENGIITQTNSQTNGGIGMEAYSGGTVTNGETGIILGTIRTGMEAYGEKSTAINDGSISSDGIEYTDTYIIEDGSIQTYLGTNGATGMEAYDGGSITNGATGIISGIISEGMATEGEGSTAINDGSISSDGVEYTNTYTDVDGITRTESRTEGATGMEAYSGGSVTNGATGIISGIISEGMKAEWSGSTAINNGMISSDGVEYTDTYTDTDGVEQTYKNIDGGTGMEAYDGGSIANNGTISGTLSYGMDTYGEKSTAVNNGKINFDGTLETYFSNYEGIIYESKYMNAIGMDAGGGATITNGIDGIISGALVTGMSGTGTNLGTITIEQIPDEIPDYLDISGMYVYGETYYDENGESTSVNSTIENYGTININAENGAGMRISSGATAINGETGIINLNSIDGNGMYAYGTAYDENGESTAVLSTAKNSGTININAENGIGMSALYGATAINEETGIINLNSLNGIGMYATGEGSTIENRGEIYLSGTQVNDGYLTAEEIATSFGTTINGEDNKGNIGMKIENGAKMINKGSIVFGE